MKQYEYATSDGEGTLIKYGVTRFYATLRRLQQEALRNGHTMIFATVGAECETGK